MKSITQPNILLLAALMVTANCAYSQDIIWVQPYSGNVMYGPFASEPGELPNCPECECDVCKPSGCKGLLKRFWGGLCDRVQQGRREYYFNKQIYHTGYTRPVLPPYCEPGFGYYETGWRQSASPIFCDPYLHGGIPVQTESAVDESLPSAPAPIPYDLPTQEEPTPSTEPNNANPNEQTRRLPFEVIEEQVGFEKPKYEMTSSKTGQGHWKPTSTRPTGSESKLSYPEYPQ